MGVLGTAIGLTILPGLSRAGESVGQQPVLETMTVVDPAVIDFGAFKLPYNHQNVELRPFLGKKATILFNMKIDDPQTVLQFPDLAEIYRKYKAQGLNVHTFPTEQGWFEPDDDEACRAKAKEFYSFGDYPNSVVFDKIDLLGPSAHPLYKSLTKKISTPNGYGRITLNYEKFLLDADGNPVRRYPRKFTAYDMEPDITALLEGKQLPEESPAFKKAWREAKREVIKSEYAFRFNYNYYDSPESMYKYDANKDQIK
jgi:glutathione peroxidase